MTITPKTNFFPRFLPKLAQPRNLPLKTSLVMCFLKILKIDLTRRGQSSKFDLILPQKHVLACCSDPAGPIWTKIGTVKQLDPGNKPVTAFLQNLQIWPHTEMSKLKIWHNFPPKSRFESNLYIRIIKIQNKTKKHAGKSPIYGHTKLHYKIYVSFYVVTLFINF